MDDQNRDETSANDRMDFPEQRQHTFAADIEQPRAGQRESDDRPDKKPPSQSVPLDANRSADMLRPEHAEDDEKEKCSEDMDRSGDFFEPMGFIAELPFHPEPGPREPVKEPSAGQH